MAGQSSDGLRANGWCRARCRNESTDVISHFVRRSVGGAWDCENNPGAAVWFSERKTPRSKMDSPRGEPIFDGGMMTDSRGVPAAVRGFVYRDPYEYKGQLL